MRIIGGAYKGQRIVAPKGLVARPTTDRTRESLFNILASRADVQFENAHILDLFAGSGALGLEAMSRGGAFCLFVETDASARGAIRDNVETLGLFGATRIHRRSAIALGARPSSAGETFTLVFLDPPYGKGLAQKAIDGLCAGDWLAPGAVLCAEQGVKEPPVKSDAVEQLDQRKFGAGMITIMKAT
ncbi:MAG: 16S rRNA (guanine(966)-N(2))-methyltransferase RsmD [Marinicaulis sp.]|nr:16S rRNA (guanine(966)-N(2))-methyltransferase RsmD [Marinicaulis sp.]NNL87835.1 16S rRNA (guanine(966)-N(2))-methyltransferase RsmD [Marinicaulis sp.]